MSKEKIIFADKKLAERIERVDGLSNAAFVDARAKLFPDSNAEWREIGGAFAMFDTVESPLTQVFGLGLFQETDADTIKEIEGFFRNHNAPVLIEVCSLADISVSNLLHERGYQPVEQSNVLVKPIDEEFPLTFLSEVQARLVRTEEKDVWINTIAKGWSEGNEEITQMFSDISQVSFETKGTHCFAAILNNEIIGGGVAIICEGIAALAGVSTVTEHRRKGAQNALFNFRINFAREHNCDMATVVTLPGSDSQRNAERNGFRVAYTRMKWMLN